MKNKRRILKVILLAFIFTTWAFFSVGFVYGITAPEGEWNRTSGEYYSDEANSVLQTTDGAAAEDLADNNLAFTEDFATGALSSPDGWSEDIRITTDSADSSFPAIAVDTTNNVHITWRDNRDGNDEIYYTKLDSNGTTLVDDTRITDSADSLTPAIAVDTTKNVHITWVHNVGLNFEIYYTKLDSNGTTLVDDTRLTTDSAYSSFPAIAVDTTNNVHITWTDTRDGNEEIYYTKLDSNGTTLVDDTRLTTDSASSQEPAIAVDTTNNVHITWWDYRDWNYEIYYSKLDNSGTTLVDDTRITTNSATSASPDIAVDMTNCVRITWEDYRDGNAEIYYTKLDSNGTTLVDDTRLTTDSASSSNPAIAADTTNNVHITWRDYRDGNWELYYTKLDSNGTTLVDDTRLTTDSADSIVRDIAVDMTNCVRITWEDYRDGNAEIYYKNNCGGAPPENQPPTALIDSISPNPAKQGKDIISFIGHGNDSNGSVVAYNWTSSIDGLLNTSPSFTIPASELSVGMHIIFFTVQDDYGAWSSAATDFVMIEVNQPPVASFSYLPVNPAMNETVTFNASASYDPDGNITSYNWSFGDGNSTNTTGSIITHSYAAVGEYTVNLTITDDEGATNTTSKVIKVFSDVPYLDTEPGTYPSICGIHNGTIEMTHTVNVSKICIYSCTGTGGHIEYARIWNSSWEGTEAHWHGYVDNWHNCSFDKNFTLVAGERYNFTIITGSYPQMHHTSELLTAKGWITCTDFIDINGKRREGWIPAIRLH